MVINNPHKVRDNKLKEAYHKYCNSHTIYPQSISNRIGDMLCRVTPIKHSFESFKNNKELIEIWIKK